MYRELWNDRLCSEGGEQLVHDVILIQLVFNILEGNITKSGQPDLRECVVGERILSI